MTFVADETASSEPTVTNDPGAFWLLCSVLIHEAVRAPVATRTSSPSPPGGGEGRPGDLEGDCGVDAANGAGVDGRRRLGAVLVETKEVARSVNHDDDVSPCVEGYAAAGRVGRRGRSRDLAVDARRT